ncbi:pentapeptide repeat-containing protein [Actinomadura graeca]|uniref:pentapeptide repeat-containing protein n=1 Tax=Actinomadura graeca TaxID=2750812 RepID=UPI001E32058F|nr:pentapeptide repeat-containing protein [Actinomadura graeca]
MAALKRRGVGPAGWTPHWFRHTHATLTDANLTGARLVGANLTGANLVGANLTSAILLRARWSRNQVPLATVWPEGWAAAMLRRSTQHGPGLYQVMAEGNPGQAATPTT